MDPSEQQAGDPLKVAFVSASFGYGNDLMYYGEIFRELRERLPGMLVCVDSGAAIRNPYGLPLDPMLAQIRIPRTRTMPSGATYRTSINLASPSFPFRLMARKADVVVVVEFTMAALAGVLAARFSQDTRLVLWIESDPALRGAPKNRLVRWIKRRAAALADVVQTNNEAGKRYLVEELLVQPNKVLVAPYLTSCPPMSEHSRADRDDSQLRLLFMNSLIELKGLDHLLQALALIPPEDRARLSLTVVGSGPLAVNYARLADELGLADSVIFAGHCPYAELGGHLAQADVLVVPSLGDYRSLTSFEGLNYGLALLVSRNDGASLETVREGETGFTFDPLDHVGLARLISGFLADSELLARCQAGSRELGRSTYSLAAVCKNIAGAVRQAMAVGKS